MPTLPAPEPLFGADLTKKRPIKSTVLFVGHIVVTAALIAWALLSGTTVYPIDPAFGNRTEWSPSEIAWAFAVVNVIAFLFHWSAYAISLDDIRTREINSSLYRYAENVVVDWVLDIYGVRISADKAYSLLKGQTINVLSERVGESNKWLNVYLNRSIDFVSHHLNDERVPESFLYGRRHVDNDDMRLIVIPDPTPRPTAYELPTRAKLASEAMARADRKSSGVKYPGAVTGKADRKG